MKGDFGTDVPTPAKVGKEFPNDDPPKTIEKLINHTPWGKLIDANFVGVVELVPVGKGENLPGALIVEPITLGVFETASFGERIDPLLNDTTPTLFRFVFELEFFVFDISKIFVIITPSFVIFASTSLMASFNAAGVGGGE